MTQSAHSLKIAENLLLSSSTLNSLELAQILKTEADILNLIQKCWGFGYVFTKISHNSWSLERSDFVESDWFINYSPVDEEVVSSKYGSR